MRRRPLVSLMVAASVSVGCAESAPTAPEPGPVAEPGLPVSELLDSAAFARAVRTLSQSPTLPKATGRVAVAYAMVNDSVSWIQPLWDPPAQLADSLAAVIRRVAKPSGVTAVREGITLSIAVDATASVVARASLREPPRLINREEIALAIQILSGEVQIFGSWEFWLRLDNTGRVVEVVTRKNPGSDQAADRMASLMAGCRFAPATVDGYAVPIWASLPAGR
jgi:hypothetical protein